MAGHIQTSKNVHWNTPAKVVDAVRATFGGTISLDPCSNSGSIVGAEVSYTLPTDGLKESWAYPYIYVNPSYGRDKTRGTSIYNWVAKCRDAHSEHGSNVISVIPAAVDTAHWQNIIFPTSSAVLFFKGRLKFIGGKAAAPMACAAVFWSSSIRLTDFEKAFQGLGTVVVP